MYAWSVEYCGSEGKLQPSPRLISDNKIDRHRHGSSPSPSMYHILTIPSSSPTRTCFSLYNVFYTFALMTSLHPLLSLTTAPATTTTTLTDIESPPINPLVLAADTRFPSPPASRAQAPSFCPVHPYQQGKVKHERQGKGAMGRGE